MKLSDKLNAFNILSTFIIGIVTLIISINTYRSTERINDLTLKQAIINQAKNKTALENSTLELVSELQFMPLEDNVTEGNKTAFLKSLIAMNIILKDQLQNEYLLQNNKLFNAWREALLSTSFYVKLSNDVHETTEISNEKINILSHSTTGMLHYHKDMDSITRFVLLSLH